MDELAVLHKFLYDIRDTEIRGSTMTATNHDDQRHNLSNDVNLAISEKYAVSFSRFHCCGQGSRPNGKRTGMLAFMASAGVRAYNGGMGAEPPVGSRSKAPGQVVRGQSPPEAENILKYRQHIFAVKYDENPMMKHRTTA